MCWSPRGRDLQGFMIVAGQYRGAGSPRVCHHGGPGSDIGFHERLQGECRGVLDLRQADSAPTIVGDLDGSSDQSLACSASAGLAWPGASEERPIDLDPAGQGLTIGRVHDLRQDVEVAALNPRASPLPI